MLWRIIKGIIYLVLRSNRSVWMRANPLLGVAVTPEDMDRGNTSSLPAAFDLSEPTEIVATRARVLY